MKKAIIYFFALLLLVNCKPNTKKNKEETFVKTEQKTPLQKSIAKGKKIYSNNCAQCHLPTGKGIPKVYPPLRKSNWLTDKRIETIKAVKNGLSGKITVNNEVYNNVMTPMGLSDEEVVDVLNYVMNSWENTQEKMVTLEEVQQALK